ncbi:MAG: glycosyltransferase family 2 protein [Candidatus Omnitrophota bacterium]
MRFCILIPVFNGGTTLEPLIKEIKTFAGDIIIVNDGSTDESALIAQAANVTIISHSQNRGKGAALKTGFEYILKNTAFEYVVIIDADGQHSPRSIPHFIEKLQETNADIIIGNRMEDVSAMPFIRRLTNRTMSFLISKIAGQNIPDSQCGYRLLSRRVLEEIDLETSNYDTESELLFKAAEKKIRIDSVKVPTIYQKEESKINPLKDTVRFVNLLMRMLILKK